MFAEVAAENVYFWATMLALIVFLFWSIYTPKRDMHDDI